MDDLERALLAGAGLGTGAPKPKPLQLLRVTIATASPLTVTLPSGATVPAVRAFPSGTYAAGQGTPALYQDGLPPLVFPTA